MPSLPCFYDDRTFGVQQDAEEFLPLSAQLVLYLTVHLDRDLPTGSLGGNQLYPV